MIITGELTDKELLEMLSGNSNAVEESEYILHKLTGVEFKKYLDMVYPDEFKI